MVVTMCCFVVVVIIDVVWFVVGLHDISVNIPFVGGFIPSLRSSFFFYLFQSGNIVYFSSSNIV